MSKHYYIESDRIVSKIGGGMENLNYNIYDHVYAFDIQNESDYEKKGLSNDTMMYRHIDSVNVSDEVLMSADFKSIGSFIHNNERENDIYYYHKDHIGSSTQISDYRARIIHHIEYMPSGEQFAEQRSTWGTSYKFNSKELDAETGLYYYGARYYTPEIGIWLSVDPLSDKTPNVSPYAYCINNPVRFIDPDGRDWYESGDGSAVIWNKGNAKEISVNGENYSNIGKSYSSQMSDGNFVNYFQNYAVSTGKKENALGALVGNKDLRDKFMSSKSVSTEDKSTIMKTLVANRGVSMPDMVGVQFSGNAIVGGGMAFDITLGFVKDEGFFLNGSIGGGVGFDVSTSVGIIAGDYCGNGSPSSDKLRDGSLFQNASIGPINVTTGQDVSPIGSKIGQNWKTTTIGGGKSFLGGYSTGASYTTPPIKF